MCHRVLHRQTPEPALSRLVLIVLFVAVMAFL